MFTSQIFRLMNSKVMIFIAGMLLATLFVGGIAYASNDSTIYACVSKINGIPVIVKTPDACGRFSTPLEWNKEGLQGPEGPQGPPGTAGISGWEYIKGYLEIAPGGFGDVLLDCPDGKKVLGGGFHANYMQIVSSYPYPSGERWALSAWNTTDDNELLVGFAICAYVSP